jgi:hypothetical protein
MNSKEVVAIVVGVLFSIPAVVWLVSWIINCVMRCCEKIKSVRTNHHELQAENGIVDQPRGAEIEMILMHRPNQSLPDYNVII